MKTKKQIYLKMEERGKELLQESVRQDQIVVTEKSFLDCFSEPKDHHVLNPIPIISNGVFIQETDTYSDYLLFDVQELFEGAYRMFCKSFQINKTKEFGPLWSYNAEVMVYYGDGTEIELQTKSFANAFTSVYTKQNKLAMAEKYVADNVERYTQNILSFVKVMSWMNYLSKNPEIKILENNDRKSMRKQQSHLNEEPKQKQKQIIINGIKFISNNSQIMSKLQSRKIQRLTESWTVRGHYRHYKNGKTIYISSYTKGKKDGEKFGKKYSLP